MIIIAEAITECFEHLVKAHGCINVELLRSPEMRSAIQTIFVDDQKSGLILPTDICIVYVTRRGKGPFPLSGLALGRERIEQLGNGWGIAAIEFTRESVRNNLAPLFEKFESALTALVSGKELPRCADCGSMMVQRRSCFTCQNCGSNSGVS